VFIQTSFAIGLLRSARAISVTRGGPAVDLASGALEATTAAGVEPVTLTSFQGAAAETIRTVPAHHPDLSDLSIEGPWGSGNVGPEAGATRRH
jgi:hypothetical protein